MQVGKMTKKSMIMFFSNPTLTYIWKYCNYKNMDKIKTLLIELPYGKVI